jgi:uncharacterized protein
VNKSLNIRPLDLKIVQAILNSSLPQTARVYVFGSRALGTTKRSSDLDLAIDLGRVLDPKETTQLVLAFEDSDLPYKVDIIDLHSVDAFFKQMIEKDKIALPGFGL